MTLHVMPVGDLTTHDPEDSCACGPEAVPVKREDGSVAWMIVHHSLDGRESAEHGTDRAYCNLCGEVMHGAALSAHLYLMHPDQYPGSTL